MNKPLASVSFFPHKILFEKFNGETVESKNISATSLAQAFAQNAAFDTGILPTNHGVIRYIEKNNRILLFFQVPAKKRNIKYRDEAVNADYNNIPMPHSLFAFMFQRGSDGKFQKIHERVFATKGPILTPTDELYHMPFTNVHPGGEICWGGHRYATSYSNLAGVASIPDQFFATPFNNHLEGHRFTATDFTVAGRNARVSTVSTLFNALQGMETFPDKVLIPQATFGKMADQIIGIM